MSDWVVPVERRLPIGRVEYAVASTRIYGIDRAGQVFVLGRALPAERSRGAVARLIASITRRRP